MINKRWKSAVRPLVTLILILSFLFCGTPASKVSASHTPNPSTATIAGSLQNELGASGDWQPDAAVTHLTYDANDDVWQGVFAVPAGSWEYKAALNDSWDENYGDHAIRNGANIALSLAAPTTVKFYYDHKTHWVTDNVNSAIATVPGSFQSEIGCPGDWDPGCLRSWLQDPDGDDVYSFSAVIPAGSYEAKVAIDESWTENYGQGGVQNGANILFTVATAGPILFSYNPTSHILTVTPYDASITVKKFHDKNANGVFDGGDEWLTGWQVDATDPAEVNSSVYTPATISAAAPGEWSFDEGNPAGTQQTASYVDAVPTVPFPADPARVNVAGTSGETHEVIFGNVGLGQVTACKAYDSNSNGKADKGEPMITGWKMELTGTVANGIPYGPVDQLTGADGSTTFTGLLPGDYTLTEILPSTGSWFSTGPTSYSFTISSTLTGSVISGSSFKFTFKNRCDCFDSKGYWHSKDGLGELYADSDFAALLAYINSLDPYDAPTGYFNKGEEPFDGYDEFAKPVPPAIDSLNHFGLVYNEISQFLVDPNTRGGGRYQEQLAQQLLAFIFNANYRLADSGATIQLPGGTWMTPDAVITAAVNAWGTANTGDDKYWTPVLDGLNNNNSTVCPVAYYYIIGWANLQWPPAMTHTISVADRTDNAYGQVWIDGKTNEPGQTPTLRAQLGFGPAGSNPAGNPAWTWVEASFYVDAGNNDEFVASMLPETTGLFDYVYRYTTSDGLYWLYADLNGPVPVGDTPANPGKLTVTPSSDTTPPGVLGGLKVVSAAPAAIELAWDAVIDPTLYGYEVARSNSSGGPYTMMARITGTSYSDSSVVEGATYYYVVRSVDNSFNRSSYSSEVEATAAFRTVTVTFNVTVPATTDATGLSVYIAGSLSLLDGGLPDWNPGGVVLTRVDATHWTITITGKESTQIQYRYALGDWDHVEKDGTCGEISNRQLTLSYGSNGLQTVNDTVLNWRNVSPCGS